MIYYVRNKAGVFFKLDYPCFGMLSNLDGLANSGWRNDIHELIDGRWISPHENRPSSWDNAEVPGFGVTDLETIYMPTYGQEINISHPFFRRLREEVLPEGILRNDFASNEISCIVMDLENGVPCDELFMPLFAAREVSENSNCRSVYDLVKTWNVPEHLAIFFGATFYKSTAWDYQGGNRNMSTVFYPHQEDGGTFSNGKLGDLINIMNGAQPRYISSNWGSLDRGYPAYGVTEVNHDEDDWETEELSHESYDLVSQRIHHMNDSLILQRTYPDEFFSKHLNSSNFNRMSEQEFRPLVMEILQYVNDQTGA